MKKLFLLFTVMLATSMSLLAQGTTWQTATLISSGQTKTATLDASTTEVWYKITVAQEGKVELTATANEGLTFYRGYSQVYGYWNDNIQYWGNFSGDNYGNLLTFNATNVGKGTYYIRISRNNGSGTFTLKYKFTRCPLNNDPEPNDDYEHASLLQSGTTAQGRLGYRTSDNVTDAYDWYKIVVPEEGRVELIVTATEDLVFYRGYTQVYGYWNDNIQYWGNFSGDNYSDTLTFNATNAGKGTYYIRISRNNGSGGYRLKYTFTPCPLSADPEPNDDYEHASLLQSGTTAQGRLGYRTSDNVTDAYDWYKIVVPEEGHVELIVTATEDLKFYKGYTQVYGYWNDNIQYWGNFSGDNYSDTLTFNATNAGKGTYYIRISRNNGSGGYRLKYTFTPCPLENDFEPNNDYQHYNRLINGKTAEGRMGYRTSDNVTDTEDWYRFIVPKDGDIELIVTATENLKFFRNSCYVYVFRNDNISGFGGFSGESYAQNLTFNATNVSKGTYYIKLAYSSGSGGYTIRYNGPISDIPGDVDGDGQVNIGDISDITDYLLNGNPSNPLPNGDADGDGRITIGDITALIDVLLGNG